MKEIQLVVTTPPRQVRIYPVTKELLTIGRASTCDIVLYDPGVSRGHARLCRVQDGYEIEDVGSTNGVWVQGQVIGRATPLLIGQTARIANSTLRLQEATPQIPDDSTLRTLAELTSVLSSSAMEMELPDLSQPRLVIHTQWHTWEITLSAEATLIGRQSNCQVLLNDTSVSRQHARIIREGDNFILVDLDSHNGTWLNEQRIEKHKLRPGDSFKIGNATMVYNAPLGTEDDTLRLAQVYALQRGTRRPIVFVPGFMGSELWRGSERIWPNVKAMFTNPEVYRWPSKDTIEARNLISEIVVIPKFLKIERYGALGDFLCEDLGYVRGKDLLEFPWDWRIDPRVAARQLGKAIMDWRERVKEARAPVTIIAHSLGCVVARYYVEKLNGQTAVNRMILIGGTHNGLPKSLQVFGAFGKQPPLYAIAEPFQHAIASAPSIYTMLPSHTSILDSSRKTIDLYQDESWCPEENRELLRNAAAFHRELKVRSQVPTVSIFGYGIQTTTQVILENRLSNGGWGTIHYNVDDKGDDTVPQDSARLPNTEIHPVRQHHAALYIDNDVKERLKLELLR
jgi:pSer/pThr/pTyr-binding forkhead associated (FHA) protein